MKSIATVCSSHCGGACPLKVQTDGGAAKHVETDAEQRACLRGRAYRQRLYAPDRLLFPLKRAGQRGSGQFTRITWDEALDTTASEIRRVRDTYGPAAIAAIRSGGDIVQLHNAGWVEALLAKSGGYTGTWGMHSAEGAWFASLATYGALASGNNRDDFINSSLIILWGWNPAVTIAYDSTTWQLARAKEAGARIVSIDPRYTSTTSVLADEWIPIRPGTDTALLVAMAYVLIIEDLQDKTFLDRFTVGFEQFRDYVLGAQDGVPKTPAWAEAITGVPSDTTVALAREYATRKPAALMDGMAVGRTAYGEQFHRAAATLSAMSGNIGIPGGNAAGYACMGGKSPLVNLGPPASSRVKGSDNPVDLRTGLRPFGDFASMGGPSAARVNRFLLADAILKGRKGGYPADLKLLYVVNCNYLNQCANTTKIAEALKSLEFVVVQEQFMTATARYADIILPTTTLLERNDVCGGGVAPFYGYLNQAVTALGEAKSHFDICRELAARLGMSDFSDKTEEDWLKEIVAGCGDLPEYETFKKEGIHRLELDKPYVHFESNVKNASDRPFPTPSGKIEIYSERLAGANDASLPPIPTYLETWESRNDPLASRYPLQLITSHTARRAHSTFERLPWLKELYPQALAISVIDAEARGIKEGELVRVFNDRGQTVIRAAVTQRIMPGVVDLPEGAWYTPDGNGVDRGGCANVLSRDVGSPGGAFPSNTALVQVERA